jgi:putative spermidine/putrescine transport system permease protein
VGETYADQFIDLNEAWEDPVAWAQLMGDPEWIAEQEAWTAADDDDVPLPLFQLAPGIAEILPETADAYRSFARTIQSEDEDSPLEEEPWNTVYLALYRDLAGGADVSGYTGPRAGMLAEAAGAVDGFETVELRALFEDIDEAWVGMPMWETIEAFSDPYTAGYFLAAVDLQLTPDGIEAQPEEQRIYLLLFERTIFMSLVITISCILLGYPIAFLLSNLPLRTSNILLILVLLPFWTSLLVRTSAWKVLLQNQGVINDTLVWIGLVADDARLALINNQTGTIIAMTHILLPFMILPLYSVMKTIPPSYVRAARSLGATQWTAFWRVYFPNSVPGIGAGSILVFILSIGYYITPELVGGRTGTFISNRIAFHISESLNWGLAAALGSILLALVLVLYWLYDKFVGIDNVKLG